MTVVYIDPKGRRTVWKLSRGQYYAEGMIRSEDRKQAKRFKVLEGRFTSLATSGGSLRASSSPELRAYFAKYAEFAEEWWALALKRRESRSKLQRYMGKTSALRGFFDRLRAELRRGTPTFRSVFSLVRDAAVKGFEASQYEIGELSRK